jgi:hypothetical protein
MQNACTYGIMNIRKAALDCHLISLHEKSGTPALPLLHLVELISSLSAKSVLAGEKLVATYSIST